jgi:hypothetical protein
MLINIKNRVRLESMAEVKVEHDFRTLRDLTTIADTSPDIKAGNEAALV